jgi:DNA-binding NarL/FixJ family response regulator
MKGGYTVDLPAPHMAQEDVVVAVAIEESLLRRRIVATLTADGVTVAREGGSALEPLHVVVMAGSLGSDWVGELRNAVDACRPTPVVFVSPRADASGLRRALVAGARGLVLDSEVDAVLTATVLAVAAGRLCVPCDINLVANKPTLSHREREVLKLAVSGRTNAEIAVALCLAESTIKSHLSSAFNRLGVHSRREAATLVLDPEQGLAAIVLGTHTATPGWAAANGDRPRHT